MKQAGLFVGGVGVVFVGRAMFFQGWRVTGAITVAVGALVVGHVLTDCVIDTAFGGMS